MDAAFVSDERNGEQNEHYDQDDALFVFGELKNPEQALHFIVAQLGLLLGFSLSHLHGTVSVMLSEALQRNAKHKTRLSNISDSSSVTRRIKMIRDSSLRSE